MGETVSVGNEEHWTLGLSQELQNSVAIELERKAAHDVERLMKGLNVGAWESAITFGTGSEIGRTTLAGMLRGELSSAMPYGARPYTVMDPDDKPRPVLLPKSVKPGESYPLHVANCLTSEELALVAAPPAEAVPGYDIREIPVLSLNSSNDIGRIPRKGQALGTICDHGHPLDGVEVHVDRKDLAKHVFVCGLTGSGKTTTMMEILSAVDVPFLVLESAKREYRSLLGSPKLGKLQVFTPGDASIAPLKMNPFYIQAGVRVGEHVDFLKAIFNASFSFYGPMPYIVERCLHNIYRRRGWDLERGTHPQLHHPDGQPNERIYRAEESQYYFPTISDLRDEVERYVRKSGYRGELNDNIRTAIVARLESLSVGGKGQLLASRSPLDIERLLSQPTVLELEALADNDDKAFVIGILLAFISEYRRVKDPARNPIREPLDGHVEHVLVVEEAHRLLKNVTQERTTEQLGNPRGKAVEFFADVISEMRSLGQGVAVVEQIPSKLVPDVIKNTSMKIVHRLVSQDDQALLASPLGLEEREALYLTSMRTGHALFAREGMRRPVEFKIRYETRAMRFGDDKVREKMSCRNRQEERDELDLRQAIGLKARKLSIQLLCSLACGFLGAFRAYGDEAVGAAKLALQRRQKKTVQEATMRRSLTAEVIERLTVGVFRIDGSSLKDMMRMIDESLQGDENAGKELLARLAEGWEVTEPREGALDRIAELAVDGLWKRGAGHVHHDLVAEVVQSYFLPPWCSEMSSTIIPLVVERVKGVRWQSK